MTYYPQPNAPYPPGAYPPGGPPPPAGPAPAPAGPRQYSIFHPLFMFWSPKLWRDVGQRWRGIGLMYMLLLLIVTWTPVFIFGVREFDRFLATEGPTITSQVPKITIQNGIVTADVPQPYYISDPGSGKAIICIDTTGQVTKPTKDMPVLLTKDTLSIRQETGKIESMPLNDVQYFQLDSQKAAGYLQTVRTWALVIGIPLFFFSSWIWRLVLMLVYGALGLAINSGLRAPLTYAGLMRLSAVCMTPVILIDTIFWLPNTPPGGCWWTIGGIVIALVLLWLAIKANAPEASQRPYYGPPGFAPVQAPAWPAPPQAGPYGYGAPPAPPPPPYGHPAYGQQQPYGQQPPYGQAGGPPPAPPA